MSAPITAAAITIRRNPSQEDRGISGELAADRREDREPAAAGHRRCRFGEIHRDGGEFVPESDTFEIDQAGFDFVDGQPSFTGGVVQRPPRLLPLGVGAPDTRRIALHGRGFEDLGHGFLRR